MKKNYIYTIKDLPEDQTNLDQVRKMSDREIHRRARSDYLVKPLNRKQLSQFKRVHPPEELDVKVIRNQLHISQSVFAKFFGISLRTLQDWEQGRRHPKGPARILLVLIAHKPKWVQDALGGY